MGSVNSSPPVMNLANGGVVSVTFVTQTTFESQQNEERISVGVARYHLHATGTERQRNTAPFGAEECDGELRAPQPNKCLITPVLPQSTSDNEYEEACGVCFERPGDCCFVELWCCGNILCVDDAYHLARCPFCRSEPLVWEITK
ncbi:hypothetical protein TRVL_04861 [Trypanosoma vivax]|uniref:Uncharacterized protein n=1 Tax=Trypanosoma vivax (strain Y486) TaxID=1055687 RepID=G0TV34_TRYVY|nr:hypothetical protein TRVL_04861 [Trypanosoma vivax]CCC47799.1 conserved hypothetical protein [Trypanosoma vivax Y486]